MNPTPTLPEAPETLAVQLAWLRAGRRRAVLVTVLNARLRHLQRQPTIVERDGALHLDLC